MVGLLQAGKHAEADAFVTKNWLGRNQQCYQPLGDLHLEFTPAAARSPATAATSTCGTGTAGVSYRRDGVIFTREVFASHPDQVIVIRLRAGQAGRAGLHRQLQLGAPHRQDARSTGEELVLRGQLPGFVARRPMKTIEEWGDQHKYPELYDRAGKRLPHAEQVLYGKAIGGKGMFFEARLAIQTDGKVAASRRRACASRAPARRCS